MIANRTTKRENWDIDEGFLDLQAKPNTNGNSQSASAWNHSVWHKTNGTNANLDTFKCERERIRPLCLQLILGDGNVGEWKGDEMEPVSQKPCEPGQGKLKSVICEDCTIPANTNSVRGRSHWFLCEFPCLTEARDFRKLPSQCTLTQASVSPLPIVTNGRLQNQLWTTVHRCAIVVKSSILMIGHYSPD